MTQGIGKFLCQPEWVRVDRPFALAPPSELPAFTEASRWREFPVHGDPVPRIRRDDLNDRILDQEGGPRKGPCAFEPRPKVQLCEEARAPLSRTTAPPSTVEGREDIYVRRDVPEETLLRTGRSTRSVITPPPPATASSLDDFFAEPTFAHASGVPRGVFRQWTSGKSAEDW